jgi:transposase
MILPPDFALLDSAAKDALILMLIERVNRLEAEVAALRAKLGEPPKTPENSSLPPSAGRKPSGGGGERERQRRLKRMGQARPLHPAPDETREERAAACGACGADVSGVAQAPGESYDRIDIPEIKPHVTRVILHGGACPCCGERFKAKPPSGLEPGSPFGPNLRALAIYLRFQHAIGLDRLKRLMSDVFGLSISEGALVNLLKAAVKPFAAARAKIAETLKAGRVIASDETGMRVGKANNWLWVFQHGGNAVFAVAASRSKSVPEGFLGGHRPEYWISDRYAGQLGFAGRDNQLCLAHLIRDAQYAVDCGDSAFAPGLIGLFARACRIGRRRARLSDATLQSYAHRLDAGLDALMALKPAHPAGDKLQRMVKRYRRHFFVFLQAREVEPTNNGSERALRPAVTYRKVTNGFRTQWGAALYADIRSVLETARRRAIAPLQAIRLTLQGLPIPSAP